MGPHVTQFRFQDERARQGAHAFVPRRSAVRAADPRAHEFGSQLGGAAESGVRRFHILLLQRRLAALQDEIQFSRRCLTNPFFDLLGEHAIGHRRLRVRRKRDNALAGGDGLSQDDVVFHDGIEKGNLRAVEFVHGLDDLPRIARLRIVHRQQEAGDAQGWVGRLAHLLDDVQQPAQRLQGKGIGNHRDDDFVSRRQRFAGQDPGVRGAVHEDVIVVVAQRLQRSAQERHAGVRALQVLGYLVQRVIRRHQIDMFGRGLHGGSEGAAACVQRVANRLD